MSATSPMANTSRLIVQQEEVVEVAPDLAGRPQGGGDRVAPVQRLAERWRAASTAGSAARSSSSWACRCSSAIRAARSSMCPLSCPRIRSVTSIRAPTSTRVPDLGQRRVEISPADLLNRAGQVLERAGDAARGHPDEAEGDPEHAEADQDLPLRQASGLGDQLRARSRQEEDQRIARVGLDGALHADPGSPLHLAIPCRRPPRDRWRRAVPAPGQRDRRAG